MVEGYLRVVELEPTLDIQWNEQMYYNKYLFMLSDFANLRLQFLSCSLTVRILEALGLGIYHFLVSW